MEYRVDTVFWQNIGFCSEYYCLQMGGKKKVKLNLTKLFVQQICVSYLLCVGMIINGENTIITNIMSVFLKLHATGEGSLQICEQIYTQHIS